jgi:hypothetical protein
MTIAYQPKYFQIIASILTLALAMLAALISPATLASEDSVQQELKVYKSPSCGCCGKWVEHLNTQGLKTNVQNSNRLAEIKAELGIAPAQQSCHTALSSAGYVFEGHIPARIIKQFLANPPDHARGLAVPNMPAGSPGMEMGDRFQAYQVLLINTDGSHGVYASIDRKDQQ